MLSVSVLIPFKKNSCYCGSDNHFPANPFHSEICILYHKIYHTVADIGSSHSDTPVNSIKWTVPFGFLPEKPFLIPIFQSASFNVLPPLNPLPSHRDRHFRSTVQRYIRDNTLLQGQALRFGGKSPVLADSIFLLNLASVNPYLFQAPKRKRPMRPKDA